MESSPVYKRKKYYCKGEIIEKLRENNFKMKDCYDEICEKMFSRRDHLQIHLRNHLEQSEPSGSNNMIVEYL